MRCDRRNERRGAELAAVSAGSPASPATCAACGAALASDQRYCLECGARRGARDAALERILASLGGEPWRVLPPATVASSTYAPAHARSPTWPAGPTAVGVAVSRLVPPRLALPGPRVGAVLTLAMLAFGTLAGAAASNPTGTMGVLRRPLTLLMGAARTPVALKAAAVPPPVEAAPTPETVPPEASSGEAPAGESPAEGESSDEHSAGRSHRHGGAGTGKPPAVSKLPPVKHVFVIMLADEPSAQMFGPEAPAHYLAHTLERRGELLVRTYAVAREELANEVALISGLGPTAQIAANCPVYSDIIPTLPDKHGQYSAGTGCIYPVTAQTIGTQLEAKGLSWRVYAEALGNTPNAASCWHPAFGAPDPTTGMPAGERFATFRDPFDYFDGVLHGASCARDDVGLGSLSGDLKSAARTPAFSYIVPDLCHDGRPTPCAPGAPSGPSAADAFLRRIVPEILASPAYRRGGLLIITSDQAPATGEYADSSSCCLQPRFPAPEVAPGGASGASGSAGAPAPGAVSPGTTTPATTTPSTAAPTAAPTPAAVATTPGAPTPGPTTPAITTPGPTLVSTSTPAQPSIQLPPTGGGQVGALLLSPFVKPGTSNQEPLNDFTLLRTIEDLFGLPHLGYAGAKGVSSLEASVFSAYTGG